VREREVQLQQARERAAQLANQIAAASKELGSDWTEDRIAAFDTGETTTATIAEFNRELEAAAAEVHRADARVSAAEKAVDQAAKAREALEAEERQRWPEPPRSLSSIEADLETVRAARQEASLLAEERGRRSELEGRRHAAEADVRRLREAPEPVAPVARIPLAIAIGALACAAVSIQFHMIAVIAFFLIFLVASAIAIRTQHRSRSIVRAQREEEIREAEGRLKDVDDRIAAADEAIGARQASLNEKTAPFGVTVVGSASDLEPVERRLSAERDSATEYAAFTKRLHDARQAEADAADQLDIARRDYETVQKSFQAVEARWSQWLSHSGLDTAHTPQTAAEFVNKLRHVQLLLHQRHQATAELQTAKTRLQEAQQTVAHVLQECGDADEAAFREHAERWHELERLRAEAANLKSSLTARAGSEEAYRIMQEKLANSSRRSLEDGLAEARRALEQVRLQRDENRERLGQVDAEMRRLETSEDQERVAARLAELRASAEEALRRWAVHNMCLRLLEESRRRFERERQPAVLQQAGRYLRHITGGRYVLLIRPLSDEQAQAPELRVETAEGDTKDRSLWNRGLLEQIYLCLRLGFIEDYCTTAEPLPVIMDDVLANFDPNHAARTAETLAQFAQQHQVLYLTCHPETVGYLKKACPELSAYQLSDYQIAPLS